MYEFKIALNDDDFILFNQYHILNSPLGKRALMSYRLLFPLIGIISIFIFYLAKPDIQLVVAETITLAIFSVIWIVFSKKRILRNVVRNIRKTKKDGRLPYVPESLLKFDDDGIHEIAPDNENRTKYSLVEKIILHDKAIYIYFSSSQAYIVPMTAFSEETERNRFLEFIHMKTGK